MAILRLDKHGRLDLPRHLLNSHHWQAGMEFTLEDRPEGLLLRPLENEPKTARTQAVPHGTGGRDRALANAVRDRYARFGH